MCGSTLVAQTDVYLFGGQSNMTSGIVDGFRAEMDVLDPGGVLWTPRYRNPGVGLDSGWSGNTWLGDPPGPSRGNFHAGTNASDPNIGNAYAAMLSAWQNSISNIEGDYEIKGIIWVQGEQDAKNEISASRYASSLDNLIARLHEDVGLAAASVPFYYTSMESNSFPYRSILRTQQLAADKDSGDALSIVNAKRVDASGLAYKDNVHYTTESQTELGQRLANVVSPSATAPPIAPVGLAAVSGDGSVSLDWDDNTEFDLSSYSVYRSATPGGHTTALVANLTASDYVDSSAVNNTTYYYVVTATDTDGNESGESREAVGIPADPSNQTPTFTSDPVVEINATEGSAYSATIADDASDSESDPMVFSLVSGPDWLSVAYDGSLSGTPDLSHEGANSFTVQVVAAGGSDTTTLEITVDMDPTVPPAAPTGLGVIPGDSSVSLDWDDNSESDLVSYSVYRSTTLGSYGNALASGLTTSDYTDNTVTNDTTYYYAVTATDADGNESAQSDELDATSTAPPPSGYQINFSAAIVSADTGGNTSPWINNNISMPIIGSYTFIEGFSTLTRNAGDENLDISGAANAWLLINTETWEPGDYTVSFDGQVTSGDTMYWDVIGGNASSSGTGIRIWMNKGRPEIRAASSGTAERLGQINAAGDTAGTATQSVAAASFTDTTLTAQSLTITLTASHVGSTNDYVMIGWNNSGGNGDATIDNVSVMPVPAQTSYADRISGYNLGGQTAFTDDFDNDGLENGIEIYFGSHPGEFSQGLVPVGVTGSNFTFTHPISDAPASDIAAVYRWSKDLVAGFNADGATSDGTTVTFSPGDPVDGMITVTASIEGASTQSMFFDIEVIQN
jgi:fibronectin type 3 domain-containing protein